jgi:serine phosphatase RsbU (regulator of sigma subunit)
MPGSPIEIHLSDLITHSRNVDCHTPLADIYETLTHNEIEFIAVLDGDTLLGVCSRTRLGIVLGQRYGYALFAKEPASKHLAPEYLAVTTDVPATEVLSRAFSRVEEQFYDDVVLTTPEGRFLGFIEMRALVILQNRFFMQTIAQLETQQAELNRKNRQMKNDLFLAQQVQQALLPQEYPTIPPGVDPPQSQIRFSHYYRSADLLGGDFFHIVPLSPGRAGVFICDVMGHGVGSALITAMMRASLENHMDLDASPGRLLEDINRELFRMLRHHPHTLFATGAYLVVDVIEQRLLVACAGHPIPMRLKPNTNGCQELPLDPNAVGTPLGILENASYGTGECRLDHGDRIVLYTDGLYEILNTAGEIFGPERLKISLARHRCLPGADLLQAVLEDVGRYAGDTAFSDDICAVVVEYAGGSVCVPA